MLNLKPKLFSFIVPEALLVTASNKDLRNLMIKDYSITDLIIFDNYVFKDANIGTTIFKLI